MIASRVEETSDRFSFRIVLQAAEVVENAD